MVLKITVKTLDSNNYEFEANDDWTVKQFKEHIQETVGVQADEQRLIFCGRVLLDDKKLTEYDCNGKVIHLVRRPPPPLGGPDGPAAPEADPNNNTSTTGANDGQPRFFDEGQIFINAMTVGPESINSILRQILTLQQAAYVRGFADGPPVGTSVEPLTMTGLDRHLHNAARLLRITVNVVNECMTRIAVLPPTAPRPSSSNLTPESPRPSIIASASSHTDLQTDTEMSGSSESQQRRADATVDDMNIDGGNDGSPRRATARSAPRQSLTTDDLPQPTRPVHRFVPVTVRSQTEDQRAPLTLRQRNESELDRYLSLVNYACDLQTQFQGLARRYRQLIDMSRRGGLIVTQPTTSSNATSTGPTEQPQQPNPSAGTSSQSQPPSSLVEEARILASYIPRIMHHISHLQHALSDFSVNFERGTLQLNVSNHERAGRHRQVSRRSNIPQSSRDRFVPPQVPISQNGRVRTGPPELSATVNLSPGQQPNAPNTTPTLEGSVTITTATVETSPMISTSTTGVGPQANATIVVTSEPIQGGFQFPISFGPINFGPQPVPQASGTPNQSSDPNRPPLSQPGSSPTQNTTSNSTQTANRPLRVVSGRLPPFDFFLPCLSPWAASVYRGASSNSGSSRTPTRAEGQASRQNASAPTANQSRDIPRTQAEPMTETRHQPQATPLPNPFGQLVDQLLMGTPLQATRPAGGSSAQQPSGSPDSFINMIPEIALNAASQILGGVLGIPTTNFQNNQSTARPQQPPQPQRTQPQAPPATTGSVMMDIDIDDGPSSQPEPRYHDAHSQPPAATVNRQSELTSNRTTATQPAQAVSSRPVEPISSTSAMQGQIPRRLASILGNHPDWIPIIEADINLMESQSRASNNQPAFSDAYLSSIPRKRRRLLTTNSERVLILQPSPSQAISNLLRRAITNSSPTSNTESLDQVLDSVSSDVELQSAYEDYIKTAVEARLRSDFDYNPQKFENSSKYFK